MPPTPLRLDFQSASHACPRKQKQRPSSSSSAPKSRDDGDARSRKSNWRTSSPGEKSGRIEQESDIASKTTTRETNASREIFHIGFCR
mmetsp:Transcript_4901/g.10544  ORF Transcript_4901/g.10544 Transcript_4901/m.10544 type:complete len:88 (+) Transcript_4901:194-457(+)